ncbi:MAG: GNAT family N-acetyltransferase [Verrucomicrobia bacterium]|nr:GNAT family N-acetyltransferase [Verrucomicrobiota bacterium]
MRPGIGLLCIDTLWVAEHLRHQDYGTKLLLAAEAEGIKQGCTHSQLETLPFQAVEFYKKLGYVQIGKVEKLYGGHDALYMRKKLSQP